jgi:uncharacterized protein YhjY with autotransporter beta-barrel domain
VFRSVSLIVVLAVGPALAAPLQFTRPDVTTASGAVSVSFGGRTFVNQGLVGTGRIPSNTRDFNGDTFGAFSGMALEPASWTRSGSGYAATLFALPDRGPNDPASQSFSDFPGRLNRFTIGFTPYTSTTALPAATTSQNQVTFTQSGGLLFRDFNGQVTTGKDPGVTGSVTQRGLVLPSPATGPGAGKISLDAEAVTFRRDGSFYVSDEYGAAIYYFGANGTLSGVIQPPAAIAPRTATGAPQFSSITQSATGRRVNQGLEGVTLTPDGKKLVTLLQSATIQDSTGQQQTRTNTRLLIYDVDQNRTPTAPVGHYVLQLPIYTFNGAGGAPDRTAAQSEILALNDTQFLVLSRDGIGLGSPGGPASPVFKSVLLVDTTGATNLAGTAFETTTTPVAPGGNLLGTINPVQQVQLVNILNTTQLARFGLNINNSPASRLTLSEKLEGMALAPALDENAPQDYFLFIGNDNDFISTQCTVAGADCSSTFDNDGLMLVYRLTLPTYVDPLAYDAMTTGAPLVLEAAAQAGLAVSRAGVGDVLAHQRAARRAGWTFDGFAGWVSGSYIDHDWDEFPIPGASAKGKAFRGTLGLDYALDGTGVAGITLGYGSAEVEPAGGFEAEAAGYSVGINWSYRDGGVHAHTGYIYSRLAKNDVERAAPYGLTAVGKAGGAAHAAFAEVGYGFEMEKVTLTPVAGFRYAKSDLDAYTESGAAGGNLALPDFTRSSSVVSLGAEAAFETGGVRPVLHAGYNLELSDSARSAVVRLVNVDAAMATQTVAVSTVNQDSITAGIGVQGQVGEALWHVGYNAEIGRDERTSHAVVAGWAMKF